MKTLTTEQLVERGAFQNRKCEVCGQSFWHKSFRKTLQKRTCGAGCRYKLMRKNYGQANKKNRLENS